MKALIQRVSSAHVEIAGTTVGGIRKGLLVFLCAVKGDTEKDLEYVARKVSSLRIFEDEQGKMNRSVMEINGEVLIVSQFTLAASTRKGNRPSFDNAEAPEQAKLNAIGGPCIAHELAARRQTGVVFTGEDPQILARLKDELQTGYYHIWTSTDVVGVEVCSALKNAYAAGVALAVGMMEAAGPDGLANMYNPQAALFAQGIHEMGVLLRLLGGGLDNLHGLPGPGDLYVTVFGGRTVSLGKLLGKGIPFTEARQILAGVTLESVEIIARVAEALHKLEGRGLVKAADFPLLLHLNTIIHQGAPVNIPWDAFFRGLA